jgi:soluble lytic murein transglycosylase-like protein
MNLRMRWASAAGLAIAVWACCGGAPAESTGHVPRIVIHGGDKKPRERNVRVFQNREGVITLTNKPESYANKPGYREIEIEFDPITVPAFFRALSEDDLATDASIERLARHYAALHGLEPALVLAIIKVESNGDRTAVSHAGAQGLMQLMPETASDLAVADPFDPAQNIEGGARYLAMMLERFGGDEAKALAAYNWGPSNVEAGGRLPAETRTYLQRVARFKALYASGLDARA